MARQHEAMQDDDVWAIPWDGSKDAIGDRPLEPTTATGSSQPQGPTPTEASSAVRHVRSADLFGNAREVVIEHEHHRYRLKMTSRGGLILNK